MTPENYERLKATEGENFRKTEAIVEKMFQTMAGRGDVTWKDIAQRAKLSRSTITNLRDGKTKLPQFLTVTKLAKAIGMDLNLTEKGTMVKLNRLRLYNNKNGSKKIA